MQEIAVRVFGSRRASGEVRVGQGDVVEDRGSPGRRSAAVLARNAAIVVLRG
jgi:hypothetical protein